MSRQHAGHIPCRALIALGLALLALWAQHPAGAGAAPPLSWSSTAIAGAQAPSAISCPSEALCVAVDGAGNVLTSTNPGAPSPSWSAGSIDAGHALSAVSCASLSLCVAVDDRGAVLATTAAGAGAGSWGGAAIVDAGRALTGVFCPSTSLCIAVDEAGDVLASANPASASWTPATRIDTAGGLAGISCASVSLCVAVDHAGNAFASSNPGEAGSWRGRAIDAALTLSAVSCVPGGACVAVDGAGNALASADPGAAAPTWSSTPIDAGSLTAISCASTGLCVALDGAGIALASDGATAPLPAWSASGAGGHPSGISCLPTGLCAAVEAAGHELAARVPPPAVATTVPTEVSASTARLAGVVNPNDALLTSCYFEYGPQASYGQIAPCSSLPSPAGGAQEVSAQVTGLTPNAAYHYRLIASSASGVQAGSDQAFTTAVSSEVALVMAHPSIGGTPAVGERLTCRTGLPSSSTARVSFAWLRDLLPIAGATSSAYVVKGTDSGHHLQCQVTATNAGGSTTAKSAFVTIPAQGVLASVGETAIGRPRVHGTSVSVVVVCSAHATNGCHVVLRLTVAVHRRRVTIGATAARLARGQHRVLTLKLNSRGRHLLAHSGRLRAVLAARGTVIGVIEALLSQQRVTLGARSHGAPHHG